MQQNSWEKEYKNPLLVTRSDEPQKDVTRYIKWLKKNYTIALDGFRVLDLGCGTGRNSNYLASLDCKVSGIDIAPTAIKLAKQRAADNNLAVDYYLSSMGDKYSYADNSFDLVIDIMSSNSLNEKERALYLSEVDRVLKPTGHFFVKALCKEGDVNAKKLIQKNPGAEKDTYIIKEMGLIERIFTRDDFMSLYGEYFDIIKLAKKTNYTRFNNQSYKRNFWLAYMIKK